MDERALKRLLIIIVASLIVIFLFKGMMSRTIVNLNRVGAEKKQAVLKTPAVQQENMPVDADEIATEPSTASGVGEDAMPEPSPAY